MSRPGLAIFAIAGAFLLTVHGCDIRSVKDDIDALEKRIEKLEARP